MFQFLFRRIFMEDLGQERPGPRAQCGEGEGRRAAAAAQAWQRGRDLRPTATDRPTIRERENRTGYIEAASGKAASISVSRLTPLFLCRHRPRSLSLWGSLTRSILLSPPSFLPPPLPFPPFLLPPPKVRPTCSERYSDFVPTRLASPVEARRRPSPFEKIPQLKPV